jgi:hypothetical protein
MHWKGKMLHDDKVPTLVTTLQDPDGIAVLIHKSREVAMPAGSRNSRSLRGPTHHPKCGKVISWPVAWSSVHHGHYT